MLAQSDQKDSDVVLRMLRHGELECTDKLGLQWKCRGAG